MVFLSDLPRPTPREYAAYLTREAAAERRMRDRAPDRCVRCVWAWHPVGEFAWRCVRCTATAVSL